MLEGGCLCGAVRYSVSRSYLSASNCYCAMCRKAHGGPFSTHIPMRRDQFQILKGELKTYKSSLNGRREYCPDCGTHILVHGQVADGSVAVPVGTLDGDPPVKVTNHIFIKDRVSWYSILDELPQYDGWPPGVV
jgi:hypothetical protein